MTAVQAARRALRHDDEGTQIARDFLRKSGDESRRIGTYTDVYALSSPVLVGGQRCHIETAVNTIPHRRAPHGALVVAAYRIGRAYRLGILRSIAKEGDAWYQTPEGEELSATRRTDDWEILGYVVAAAVYEGDELGELIFCPNGIRIDDEGYPSLRHHADAETEAGS